MYRLTFWQFIVHSKLRLISLMGKRNQIAVKYEERGLTARINDGDISLMCDRSTVNSSFTTELDDMIKFKLGQYVY